MILILFFENNDWFIVVEMSMSALSCLFLFVMKKNRNNGALIREFVDSILFSLECDVDERKVKSLVLKQKKKHQEFIDIYCSNCGNDKPRGVKDWYFDYGKNDRLHEILSCQEQNLGFDNYIVTKYLYFLCFLFILILFIGIFLYYKYGFFTTLAIVSDLLCFIFLKIMFIIREKYHNVIIKSYIAGCKNNLTIKDIKHIQKHINKRRNSDIDIPNFIHNRFSNQLHYDYDYIINK